jgi:uncharacterized protein
MLGRWHGMDGKGFAISESNDPKAMYRWTARWADLYLGEKTQVTINRMTGELNGYQGDHVYFYHGTCVRGPDQYWFPREIHEGIGWYVYRLIDPRTGHTFYVGKGRGDRVFEHVKGALNEDEAEDDALIDLKTETIRDIQRQGEQVLHIIHRHGIETPEQAYLVEAALMDAYPGITNIAGGHASAEYGCRTAQQMVGTYSAEELKACEPLILIFIGRALEEGRSVYDAVRAAWRMSLQNAQNYKLVLAYDISGLVVGAFRPIRWLPATRENFHFLQTDEPRRIGFDGVRATEVESQYLKKKAPPRRP